MIAVRVTRRPPKAASKDRPGAGKTASTTCRARQVLRLRREANVGRTYNAGLRHRGLQFDSAEPSAGFRNVGDVLKD
jgi:hypothetical protein